MHRTAMTAMWLQGLLASAAPASTVSGVVHVAGDPGQPVMNARMTLFTPALTSFWETRTDAQGTYTFEDIGVGTYQLGACSLYREYIEITLTVSASGAVQNFALGPETEPGIWQIIGNTLPELFDATDIAILRPDGQVFFCHDTVDPVLFDPVTGEKSFPAGSGAEQGCMSGSLLSDGRIIMVGGQDGSDPGDFVNAIPWVKAYSADSDSWEWLPDLQLPVGRWYPGLARLADGSFLAMGGGTSPAAQRTDTCERFDLTTQTWSFTGSMLNPCEFPPSALLHNGMVLATWSPPQLYDPATGQWQATGNFNQPNRLWPGHSDHSLVVLADGRAAVFGIRRGPDQNDVMGELYDPDTQTWALTSNPGLVREQPEVVQLPDGRILVAAGRTEVNPPPVPHVLGVVKWTDLYDPSVDNWRRVADLNWFREYHAVTLLVPDGRVLTTGGTQIQFQFGPTTADIEAYTPPYLLRGVRPQITQLSDATPQRGQTLTLTIAPDTMLTNVVLMGAAAPTHWVDGGIPRRLVLSIEQAGPTATVTLPTDASVLPLGFYLMFAMVDDIPSVASIIQVHTAQAGDVDDDGDVDLADHAAFVTCLTGPCSTATCVPPLYGGSATCAAMDFEGDGDVDLRNFAQFQNAYSN